jgi:hypothetical protein
MVIHSTVHEMYEMLSVVTADLITTNKIIDSLKDKHSSGYDEITT